MDQMHVGQPGGDNIIVLKEAVLRGMSRGMEEDSRNSARTESRTAQDCAARKEDNKSERTQRLCP